MYLVATRKGLFTVVGGEIVASAFSGIPVTLVLTRGKRWFAAVEHGHYGPKLHASDDRGATWAEVGSPAFPEGADASVNTIWALERSSGGLWCGTIPGGLFRSRDDGATWQLVRSLWDRPERARWFGGGADEPGIHSICADPAEQATLRIGVSCGGVLITRDDGETWRTQSEGMTANYVPPEIASDADIQDPHCVVQCAAEPATLWCQHHCGAYRSVDGGESWQPIEVPPSSFGFAVAVHPHEPDTAWFVPAVSDDMRVPVDAKVVVSRTRDGGQSFDVLRSGLPQAHAYDLVYRHALDVDGTGTRLAFGSTTGSVWETDDGGDTWRTVSVNLPPVYCVRFAHEA